MRSDVKSFEFRDRQNQEIDYSGSYGNIEVSQTGFSKPLPTSITPLTIDPSHEQRMSEVDQVPDLLELLCEAPPDDKDCHHIDAMQVIVRVFIVFIYMPVSSYIVLVPTSQLP